MAHENAESSHEHADDQYHVSGHVVPLKVLVGVFAALLVLTYITVAATMIDLGGLNVWIALGIATVKGGLVVLYFMHLRYDSPFNAVVFVSAVAFLCLFLGVTMVDTIEYQPAVQEMSEQAE